MPNEELFDVIIDGAFAIHRKTGQGGMALVYEAEVDLGAFNYSQLYAYTQVQGTSHAERLEKSIAMSKKMNQMNLDLRTVRKILQLQNIPVPNGVVAFKLANANANVDRFMAEWRSLICLNHDNVVKVYAGGMYKKRPYYVMEYLEQVISPRSIVRDFSLLSKLEVIIQASKGVYYLHKNGIVHRDLKPSNILTCKIDRDDYVTKVCDLGLALSEASRTIKQHEKTVVGTPHYMPPEQIDHRCETDQRSDVYGLGACLYYYISGKKPFFERGTTREIIKACVSADNPISVIDLEPNVPKVLAEIIACAMRKKSSDRYQSVKELIEDLRLFCSDRRESLEKVSSFSRFERVTSNYSAGYHYLKYKKKNKTRIATSGRFNPPMKETKPQLQTHVSSRHSSVSARRSRYDHDSRSSRRSSGVESILIFLLLVGVVGGLGFGLYKSGILSHLNENKKDNPQSAETMDAESDDLVEKRVKVIGSGQHDSNTNAQ